MMMSELLGKKIVVNGIDDQTEISNTYTVIAIYPWHVLMATKNGIRRCMTRNELITRGVIQQYGPMGELVKERNELSSNFKDAKHYKKKQL